MLLYLQSTGTPLPFAFVSERPPQNNTVVNVGHVGGSQQLLMSYPDLTLFYRGRSGYEIKHLFNERIWQKKKSKDSINLGHTIHSSVKTTVVECDLFFIWTLLVPFVLKFNKGLLGCVFWENPKTDLWSQIIPIPHYQKQRKIRKKIIYHDNVMFRAPRGKETTNWSSRWRQKGKPAY